MEVFDEDKAVEYILDKLTKNPAVTKKYSEDDILEVIDIIWDYYEDNGFLDIDMSLDATNQEGIADNPEKEKIVKLVIKMVKKDKGSNLEAEDIPAIVEAELEYETQCDEL